MGAHHVSSIYGTTLKHTYIIPFRGRREGGLGLPSPEVRMCQLLLIEGSGPYQLFWWTLPARCEPVSGRGAMIGHPARRESAGGFQDAWRVRMTGVVPESWLNGL